MCRYNFFFFFLSISMCLFSYLYMEFLGLFFVLINFNYFLIKFHKPDLFNLINELVRNFRKKEFTFTAFLFSCAYDQSGLTVQEDYAL